MEMSLNATKLHSHPYYPLDLEMPNYVPNKWDTATLLSSFSTGITLLLSFTYVLVIKTRPQLPRTDLLTVMWFVMCGCIHIFFEGYFIANFNHMGSTNDLFGQLWKEYSLSDSRYLTQSPLVFCIESITVSIFGPLSLIAAYMVAKNHSLRYPFQAIVSIGHLYSDVLYYATSFFDAWVMGRENSRPEAKYFWVYFIGMNAAWILVPGVLLYQSVMATARAFDALKESKEMDAADRVMKTTR